MSPHQIAALSLRMFGLLVWVIYLPMLPLSVTDPRQALLTVTLLGLAGVLVVVPGRIAPLVLPGGARGVDSGEATTQAVQRMAFSILGLFVIFASGGALASGGLLQGEMTLTPAVNLILLVAILFGGVFLFLRSDGILILVRRFQRIGAGPRAASHASAERPVPHSGQVVAFSVLGLYLLFRGALDLVALVNYHGASDSPRIASMVLSVTLTAALRLAGGSLLFFCSSRIASFWSGLQGHSTSPEAS